MHNYGWNKKNKKNYQCVTRDKINNKIGQVRN